MTEEPDTDRWWTVPNAICALRLLGAIPLLWVAREGNREAVFWILLLLLASDWLDGKLAVLLRQRSVFGARFDSAVDSVMYAAIALSFWWLEGDVVRREIAWFLAVPGTWLLSMAVAVVRFRRMPSYHTWAAKASWLAAGTVAVLWLLTGESRPVPWALGLVILTNLEAAAIGLVLPEWRVDVGTIRDAWRERKAKEETEEDSTPC